MSGGVAGGRGGDADSRESRFAHLLEPIRDLASNWHIDLAGELEEFLHELDHIRITFEPSQSQALSQSQSQSQDDSHAYGGAKTLNFAQAALLIQGSACIYSRKVEFLYALLYQTLDALIDKRKSKQAASSISAAGDDLDAMLGAATEGALLDLDDTMVDARGIDLDDATNLDDPDANEEATHARQETMLIRAPLSLLSDNLYDASGDKESSAAAQQSLASQFKISACVMHPSGALLLEEKEATLMRHNDQLELDPGLVRTHGGGSPSGAASMPFGSPRGILLQNMQEAKQAEGIVTLSFDDQDDGGGFHDMGGDGGGFEDDDHENELEHKYDSGVADEDVGPLKKSVRFAEELEEANESISRPSLDDDDLWAQLDPHDDSALVPRPYRRGQTIRKPYVPDLGTTGADGGAISADLQIHLINSMQHANPTQAMIMRGIVKQNINAPYFAEFSTLYLREQEKRKKRKRSTPRHKVPLASALRASAPDVAVASIPLQDQDDDDGPLASDEGFGDGGGGDFESDFDAAFQLVSNEDGGEVDQWDQAGGEVVKDFTPAALDSALATIERSYEDLCKEHVAAYMRSAEQYLTSSVLSRRVLEWQDRLLPILEEEERHGAYDIQAYGRTILETVDSHKDSATSTLDFEVAVKGQPKFEICRMFLAALQLANNGNLDIVPSVMPSHGVGASMSLKLLSMEHTTMEGLEGLTLDAKPAAPSAAAAAAANEDALDSSPASTAARPRQTAASQRSKRKQDTVVDENEAPPTRTTSSTSSKLASSDSVAVDNDDEAPAKSATKKAPLAGLSASDNNRRVPRQAARR